ncbi:MAG: hypothetical protein R3C18_02425 [Planctomycetaceae bacterium]
MQLDARIVINISGLGIIMYSPCFAAHIQEGEDYLQNNYMEEADVQRHIQAGTIVGFGTGTPGTFQLQFSSGYPSAEFLNSAELKLRLGLRCRGGQIYVRDLYDLLEWEPKCPESQVISLPDGIYHVTLCSNRPSSGILGDNQIIHVFLQPLETFPALAKHGVPCLC